MKKDVCFTVLYVMFFVFFIPGCNKNEDNPPVAAFTADQTSITAGSSINFTDQSTNSPTIWS